LLPPRFRPPSKMKFERLTFAREEGDQAAPSATALHSSVQAAQAPIFAYNGRQCLLELGFVVARGQLETSDAFAVSRNGSLP
jgi:hypothetical protein